MFNTATTDNNTKLFSFNTIEDVIEPKQGRKAVAQTIQKQPGNQEDSNESRDDAEHIDLIDSA